MPLSSPGFYTCFYMSAINFHCKKKCVDKTFQRHCATICAQSGTCDTRSDDQGFFSAAFDKLSRVLIFVSS